MTKDRRLGRGLAALLGSPLDDGSVVDGTLAAAAASLPPAATHPGEFSAGAISSATANTPTIRPSLAAGRQGVTGSVPLAPSMPPAAAALQLSVYGIDNNPFQPRRKLREEIGALAASTATIAIAADSTRVGDRYQLIVVAAVMSGHSRGVEDDGSEVREADDRLRLNWPSWRICRKDLDYRRRLFCRVIDQHQCTQRTRPSG